MNRRTFLKNTSASVGALAGVEGFLARGTEEKPERPDGGLTASPLPGTYQAPDWLRYARAVYFDGYSPPVYPHMKDFDARRLVETVTKLGGDTLRFQPIGYFAYYPSKAFPVHAELEGRDLINEVSRECRQRNIHVYCYTGYGAPIMLTPEYVREHPQFAGWLLRGPEGEPYGTYSHIGWKTPRRLCTTGDAYREAIRGVVRELCEHDIDGVYFDSPSEFSYTGICFCDSCRRNFKKFSGMDLDRLRSVLDLGALPPDADMQVLTAWYAWGNQLTNEDLVDFRTIIHGSGKFMLCHNAATWRGTALRAQYRIPDGFMVEASEQTYEHLLTGLMGASMARPYKKLAQMYLGSYGISWFGQPPHEKPWAVHNTDLEDGDEIRMEGFTNLACGNAPLYATANRLYFGVGSGSAEPAQEVFALMRREENALKDSVPVPFVSIVPTWESLQLWRTRQRSWNQMMSAGMVLVMLDARVSVDVNPSTEMSEAWLKGQRVVALCGASGIADEDARRLAAWVQSGGGLLVTYDSGLYDERGEVRRGGGALKELLGLEMRGEPLESQPECYYRIKRAHPALGEHGVGAVVMGDGSLVPVEAAGGELLAECWNLGTGQVRGPAVIAREYGKGRVVYVAGSLEAHYLSSRVHSIRRLLASMVSYLGGGEPQPFELVAPLGVYGILRRAPNGDLLLWVLADVGFKDAAAGRMRQEFIPVTNVEVRIRVPEGKRVKKTRLVRAQTSLPFRLERGYAVTTLPTLHIGELVRLELEE
jgi:hypothetical protein